MVQARAYVATELVACGVSITTVLGGGIRGACNAFTNGCRLTSIPSPSFTLFIMVLAADSSTDPSVAGISNGFFTVP